MMERDDGDQRTPSLFLTLLMKRLVVTMTAAPNRWIEGAVGTGVSCVTVTVKSLG